MLIYVSIIMNTVGLLIVVLQNYNVVYIIKVILFYLHAPVSEVAKCLA